MTLNTESPRRDWPHKLIVLTGPGHRTEVQLTLKHGVWFVTGCRGTMGFGADFGIKADSWGITEVAAHRAAKKLGLQVKDLGQPQGTIWKEEEP